MAGVVAAVAEEEEEEEDKTVGDGDKDMSTRSTLPSFSEASATWSTRAFFLVGGAALLLPLLRPAGLLAAFFLPPLAGTGSRGRAEVGGLGAGGSSK